MKIYLGFAKRDLHEWKAGALVSVQSQEPRGGDLDVFNWREVDAVSLEAAEAEYSPATTEYASIARHELAPDGVTVQEIIGNEDALRTQLALLKAKRDAAQAAGVAFPQRDVDQIASLEDQLKPGLWTRIVNFFVGRN